MKRECDTIKPLLGAYADRELDAVQTEKVRQHLETCADCPRELAQIEQLHKLVKSVGHPQLAEDYWHWHRMRVWRGIRDQKRELMPRFKPSFMWTRLATVGAGVAVVLVVVIAGWRMFGEKQLLTGKGMVAETAPAGTKEAPGTRTIEKETEVAAAADEVEAARTESGKSGQAVTAGGAGQTGLGASADKVKQNVVLARGKDRKGLAERPEGSVLRRLSAQEMKQSPAAPSEPGLHAGYAAVMRDSCGVVPALLESPPMPDLDIPDTGTVLLNVMTDSNGDVMQAVVSQTSGSVLLDSIALLQTRKSRFRAVIKNNRQVPCSFEYPYRFQKQHKKQD